jgi:predicted DNA binding CopG/RHH family protein
MMTVKKSKMKSITIHGIDEPLAKLIKSKAKQEGLSINQTIKNILESSLGVKP